MSTQAGSASPAEVTHELRGRLVVSPQTAAEMLGVSRATFYNLMERGELTRVKIGRSARIRVSDLEGLVERSAES